jgi:hypothetical protein
MSNEKTCVGTVEIPVDSINGEKTVGAKLTVRGSGDGSIELKIGNERVQVNSMQLEIALKSLSLLEHSGIGFGFGFDVNDSISAVPGRPFPPFPPGPPFNPNHPRNRRRP